MTPTGTLTTLHSFCAGGPPCVDGYGGDAYVMQATNGSFYGTTFDGGDVLSGPYGTIFRLDMNLGPFVRAVPSGGIVGESVRILGNNLKAATEVSF